VASDLYIKDKTKEQILAELHGTAEPGSVVHEQQKMAILVRCTQDLEKRISELTGAIEGASKESKDLGMRVVALTRVLTIATALGAIAAALGVLKSFGIM
jgi:hypothetical protein